MGVGLNTDISHILSASYVDIGSCITKGRTPREKNPYAAFLKEHGVHSLCIYRRGSLDTSKKVSSEDIYRTGLSLATHSCIFKTTYLDNRDIRSSISSLFRSWSSGVSMCSRVIVGSCHTIGVEGTEEPHSSGTASFPMCEFCVSNQHEVAIAPSDVESVLNLFRIVVSGSEGGAIKSQGTKMKSPVIRFEKCRNKVQVPVLRSLDWS